MPRSSISVLCLNNPFKDIMSTRFGQHLAKNFMSKVTTSKQRKRERERVIMGRSGSNNNDRMKMIMSTPNIYSLTIETDTEYQHFELI